MLIIGSELILKTRDIIHAKRFYTCNMCSAFKPSTNVNKRFIINSHTTV